MFIQTETTPNPATLKFLPGREVLTEGTADFRDAAAAGEASPLAGRLFGVPGVTGVFFGFDFITVTKDPGYDWQHMKPAILGLDNGAYDDRPAGHVIVPGRCGGISGRRRILRQGRH
jgi:hypothetical protein